MGQEHSQAHASAHCRYKETYDEPSDRRPPDYEHYKRHKPRRSAESFKSEYSNESSGYRSGSSACEYSDRSSRSSYYCPSLYKNEHYKEINKEIYKPVKLHKEKRYNTLQLFEDKGDINSAGLKGYMSETDKAKAPVSQTKSCIRNYTPKILSEDEQRKKIQNWL